MSSTHATLMSEDEVTDVIKPIVLSRMAPYSVQGMHVREEEDFDGAYVFRVVVDVEDRVPAKDLMDLLADMHLQLRKRGEDRFVYLSTKRSSSSDADDQGEDAD